jgi:lysophospholipase L1-like esterase
MKKVSHLQAGEETPAPRSHILQPTPPRKPSALKRLKALAASMPREADLVLIGDSLAAAWPGELLLAAALGKQIFNFGLPGDRIQNTLWRLKTIDLAHLKPQQAIILVGTNNLGDGDEPEAIATGVMRLVGVVRQLWAEADVIVVTIPRRGPPPGFREHERLHLNRLVAGTAAKMEGTRVVDADRALGIEDSDFSSLNRTDLLHLSYEGYRRITVAIAAGRSPCTPVLDQW